MSRKLFEELPYTYFVYGLVCPLELKVKYIGCTKDVRKREMMHYGNRLNAKESPRKNQWICQLAEKGLRAPLVILGRFVNKRNALNYETLLISKHEKTILNDIRGRKPKQTLVADY